MPTIHCLAKRLSKIKEKMGMSFIHSDDIKNILRMYFPLLRSDATFLMLSNITGLRLHPLAPEESDTEEQGNLLKAIDNKTVGR